MMAASHASFINIVSRTEYLAFNLRRNCIAAAESLILTSNTGTLRRGKSLLAAPTASSPQSRHSPFTRQTHTTPIFLLATRCISYSLHTAYAAAVPCMIAASSSCLAVTSSLITSRTYCPQPYLKSSPNKEPNHEHNHHSSKS